MLPIKERMKKNSIFLYCSIITFAYAAAGCIYFVLFVPEDLHTLLSKFLVITVPFFFLSWMCRSRSWMYWLVTLCIAIIIGSRGIYIDHTNTTAIVGFFLGNSLEAAFFVVFFLVVMVGSILGYCLERIFSLLLSKFVKYPSRIFIVVYTIIFLVTVAYIFLTGMAEKKILDESHKQTIFMERIQEAVKGREITSFTTEEIVNLSIVDGLYGIEDGVIVHGYGGKIDIHKNSDFVSVTYFDVPNGENCFRVWKATNASYKHGFDTVAVGGQRNLGKEKYSYIVDEVKKACEKEGETVDIEFSGSLDLLRRQ